MERIICRNCGQESASLNTGNAVHDLYDCTECNYQWRDTSLKSKAKQLLSRLSFGMLRSENVEKNAVNN